MILQRVRLLLIGQSRTLKISERTHLTPAEFAHAMFCNSAV